MTDLAPLEGPHWDFALALYGREGVPDACLNLQERFGLDVIVLLAALYGAIRMGRTPRGNELAELDAALENWRRDVVHPLRGVRQALKTSSWGESAQTLRAKVKALELRAEQIELARAVRLVASFSEGAARTEDQLLAVALAAIRHFAGFEEPDMAVIARPIALHAAALAREHMESP